MSVDRRKLRVLIADDENAIVRIYSIGLLHYFAPDPDSSGLVRDRSYLDEGENDDRPSIEITVCQQGTEAVTLCREAIESGTPFDVVVLDIRMPPGIDGIEAATEIRALDPRVPVLFVSGFAEYTLEQLRERMAPAEQIDLIEKPVQLSRLAAKIKKIAA